MNIAAVSRHALRGLLASLWIAAGLAPASGFAQDYPSRPITIIVGYPPGSSTDNVVRPLAVALALLSKVSGVKFTGVPYKGTPQAITDLLGGQFPMAIVDVGNGVQQIRAGRLSALAISGATRSVSAPDVATLAETWPGTQLVTWIGLVAPAGTPMPVVEKLHGAISAALATPEIKQQFAAVATEIEPVSPQELGKRMQRDQVQWIDLIRAAGIQPE